VRTTGSPLAGEKALDFDSSLGSSGANWALSWGVPWMTRPRGHQVRGRGARWQQPPGPLAAAAGPLAQALGGSAGGGGVRLSRGCGVPAGRGHGPREAGLRTGAPAPGGDRDGPGPNPADRGPLVRLKFSDKGRAASNMGFRVSCWSPLRSFQAQVRIELIVEERRALAVRATSRCRGTASSVLRPRLRRIPVGSPRPSIPRVSHLRRWLRWRESWAWHHDGAT
jgi:hypothetical protein